jgi:hypothetical protein
MRRHLDVSVLPDILKALQSLQTLGIAYAVMMHMQRHCIATQKAWTCSNTAVRNSNLKQMKLDYVSKLKHGPVLNLAGNSESTNSLLLCE